MTVQHNTEEAIRHQEQAAAILQNTFGADHPRLGKSLNNLGEMLQGK